MEAYRVRADVEAVQVGLGCLVKSKKMQESFPNVLLSHGGSTLGNVPYRAGHQHMLTSSVAQRRTNNCHFIYDEVNQREKKQLHPWLNIYTMLALRRLAVSRFHGQNPAFVPGENSTKGCTLTVIGLSFCRTSDWSITSTRDGFSTSRGTEAYKQVQSPL